MSSPILHSTGAGLADIDRIQIPANRIRQKTPEYLTWLKEYLTPSIAEHGLIQPLVLHTLTGHPEYDFDLIAGESRLICCRVLGFTQVPYCFRENLPASILRELELTENIARRDNEWHEQALALLEIHNLKVAENILLSNEWGARETGQMLGVTRQNVNKVLRIAERLASGDLELRACKSLADAMRMVLERKLTEGMIILSKSHVPLGAPTLSPIAPNGTLSSPPSADEDDFFNDPLFAPLTGNHSSPGVSVIDTRIDVPLSSMLFNADFRLWAKDRPAESFDGVFTDIPYGISPEDLEDLKNFKTIEGSHQQDENIDLMPQFMQWTWYLLKPDSFCLFYYDILHQEKLRSWAEAIGFVCQPFPLLWLKPTCRNRTPDVQWPKTVEYIMVMRKGKPKMLKTMSVNYLIASNDKERKRQKNPFAKPFAMTKWICDALWMPGARIFEPFCGGGSIFNALLNCGMKPVGCEKDVDQWPELLHNVQETFMEITHGKAKFV